MNYYELLEVSPNASLDTIKMAYKGFVKKYHPDVFVGERQIAEEKMKMINEAYEVLSDPQRRKNYDIEIASHADDSFSEDDSEVSEKPLQNSTVESAETKERKNSSCLEWIAEKIGDLIGIFFLGFIIYSFISNMGFFGNKAEEVAATFDTGSQIVLKVKFQDGLFTHNDESYAVKIDGKQFANLSGGESRTLPIHLEPGEHIIQIKSGVFFSSSNKVSFFVAPAGEVYSFRFKKSLLTGRLKLYDENTNASDAARYEYMLNKELSSEEI